LVLDLPGQGIKKQNGNDTINQKLGKEIGPHYKSKKRKKGENSPPPPSPSFLSLD